jgi:hypothetical protein
VLDIELPKEKLHPIRDVDAVVDLIVRAIVAAEKQMRGESGVVGAQRLNAVAAVVLASVELPRFRAKWTAKLIARMVYGTLVRDLPASMRSKKE